MNYYCLFDKTGIRQASIPDVLATDYGGKDTLIQKGYILISDDDYQYYVGNRGTGKNSTGYVYDKATGKPVDAPPRPPVPPQSSIQIDQNALIVMEALAQQDRRLAEIEKTLKK